VKWKETLFWRDGGEKRGGGQKGKRNGRGGIWGFETKRGTRGAEHSCVSREKKKGRGGKNQKK